MNAIAVLLGFVSLPVTYSSDFLNWQDKIALRISDESGFYCVDCVCFEVTIVSSHNLFSTFTRCLGELVVCCDAVLFC